MRHALRLSILLALVMSRFGMAQTDGASAVTDPFEQPNRDRVSASISDDGDAAGEEESGFSLPSISFPKLSMPKMPKFDLPDWKMPKLSLPQVTERERRSTANTRRPSEPSAWEKFNAGTKSFFAKTRDTLMPWTVEDGDPPGPAARTASRSHDRDAEDDKPFLPFLPKKEPEERRIETVNDFFKLPRPPLE